MKITRMARNQKGFTLVELMLVVVLGGAIIATVIIAAPRVKAGIQADKDMNTIPDIMANVQGHYSLKPSFNGLTNTIANSYKLIPDDMNGGAGTITNRYGGAVTLAPATVTAADDSFSISYGGVPSRVCLKVVPQLSPQFLNVSVNGTVVKATGGALNETTAATQCNSTEANTLFFTASK